MAIYARSTPPEGDPPGHQAEQSAARGRRTHQGSFLSSSASSLSLPRFSLLLSFPL